MINGRKIIEIPAEYRPKVEELPGELARIAAEIEQQMPGKGVEITLVLAQVFRGQPVYFRSIDYLIRRIRDNAIRAEFDAGGVTMMQLASKFELSLRRIKQILAENSEAKTDDRQMRLPICEN
ncbi:MAG TPA: hypothetical protein ENJ30_02020 [Desulfobulbaceae bacterium]|nr:hypothetical protein [Desulfobulbaceae bacterium]